MDQVSVSPDHSPLRRCVCNARQELRWETPKRRMYSCGDCGIWWEEFLAATNENTAEIGAGESVGAAQPSN